MITKTSRYEKSVIIITDILIFIISYLFALWFRMHSHLFPPSGSFAFSWKHSITLLGVVIFQIYIFSQNGLYREKNFLRRIRQIPILIKSSIITVFFVLFFSYLTQGNPFLERRSVLVIAVTVQTILLIFFRIFVFRRIFHSLLKKGIGKENVLLIGDETITERLRNSLYDFDRFRFNVTKPLSSTEATIDSLKNTVEKRDINTMFLVEEGLSKDFIMNAIAYAKNNNIQIFLLSNMFDLAISKVDMTTFEGIPVIDLSLPSTYSLHTLSKRIFDIIGSLALMIVLSPIFIIVAIMIKFDSKGPIFFRQERVGKNGKKFKMLKFRSMYVNNDNSKHKEYVAKLIKEGSRDPSGSFKIVNDPRITNVGKFIRKFSLDEFPQLENVFKGDMSLVGPRPPLQYEVENYDEWHKRRLSVRPGMTGMWQVSGRNQVGFEDMVLLDIYYVENWTVWLDLQILLKTIPVVLFKRDGS
ncbi:MAG: sugar transferase [bacterium]|nr:sugar transferase [bacterium]